MLKIVSENFIYALLLFLSLFLKISRWVPLYCWELGRIIMDNKLNDEVHACFGHFGK